MNALAVVAHPDDIEFMMAGTLLLLKEAGCRLHLWNIANGSCGTEVYSKAEIIAIREKEAARAAELAEARYHPPLFDDLAVFYDAPSLARVAGVIREIQPDLIFTHSPSDYMEDHQNVCRLVVSATFARGMKNFATEPSRPPYTKPVRIYHALPHGLRDGLEKRLAPQCYVNIETTLSRKREMLACHRSQKEWLDASQGMDAYLDEMERLCLEMGTLSGQPGPAPSEAFLRHSHLGFCPPEFDPLPPLLGDRYLPADPQTNPFHS